jgi:hypothetical protein
MLCNCGRLIRPALPYEDSSCLHKDLQNLCKVIAMPKREYMLTTMSNLGDKLRDKAKNQSSEGNRRNETHIYRDWRAGNQAEMRTTLRHKSAKPQNAIYISAYGIQLWGKASTSNIEIVERFQSKVLCMLVDTLWYVPNTVIGRDLQTPTVKEEIQY